MIDSIFYIAFSTLVFEENKILNNKSLASETLREVPLNFKKFFYSS